MARGKSIPLQCRGEVRGDGHSYRQARWETISFQMRSNSLDWLVQKLQDMDRCERWLRGKIAWVGHDARLNMGSFLGRERCQKSLLDFWLDQLDG